MKSATLNSTRTEIIMHHRLTALKIVRSLYRRWNMSLELDEMQSIADRALCEAARGFDSERGANFVTYLFPFTKSAVISEIKFRQKHKGFDNRLQAAEWHDKPLEHEGVSLESIAIDDGDSPEETVYRKELQRLCMWALNRLQPLERTILIEADMREQTVTLVAKKTGYSRPYLSSVRTRAIRKLQPYLEKEAA